MEGFRIFERIGRRLNEVLKLYFAPEFVANIKRYPIHLVNISILPFLFFIIQDDNIIIREKSYFGPLIIFHLFI